MTTETIEATEAAPVTKNGWPVCGVCGMTAFSHTIHAKSDRYSKDKHKSYSTSCSYKNNSLTSGELFEAKLALTAFDSAPSNYKPTKALGARSINETALVTKRPKSKTIYLANGRHFDTLAEAREAGGVIHKATTSWVIA